MLDFFNNDEHLLLIFLVILLINIILIIMVIISNKRIKKINNNYKQFMKKVGEGKDIGEILDNYMTRVINLEEAISETNVYCKQLDKKSELCIQKVGIVKYNAYKDSGNDLSFAIALLNNKNDGLVLNGIYSREMSNIYGKPIFNGGSTYNLTDEERQAIKKAIG